MINDRGTLSARSSMFLATISPLSKKFQLDSLFEVIRARNCVHFRSTAFDTNIRYTTTNTRITTKLGTVVPDPPRYNVCLCSMYQCSIALW